MSLILHHCLRYSPRHTYEIQIPHAIHLGYSNLKGLKMSDRIEPTITVLGGSKVPVPEAVAKPNSIDGQMESVLMAWISPDEAIETGIWECSPGTFIVHRDGYDEIAQILSGSATITGEDGTVVELKVDSTIVTPEGWRGTWVVHEPIRKMFVIRRFKK
jgi:uncharacterized cupin superfamily protein